MLLRRISPVPSTLLVALTATLTAAAQPAPAPDSDAPAAAPQAEPAPPPSGVEATGSAEISREPLAGQPVLQPPELGKEAPAVEATREEPAAEPLPPPPATQLKLELDNGTSIRFGLLWQAQYEARGNSSNDDYTHNLFIRRFALLIGGTILKDFEYFFDSDFADLFKAPTGEAGVKNGPGFQTKDAFGTWRAVDDQLKVDAGLLLPPGAHNSLQAGGSILALDFFANTFRHNTVFGSTANPYGRDLGVQLRGLVGPLEYRAGVFQGYRKPATETKAASRNPFRLAARLQYNFLDPETAYFYGGTYLGTKSVFSIGGSADFQYDEDGSYRTFTGDAFLDVPGGPGGYSAQVNVVHRNGGDLIAALPEQTALMAEAGVRFDVVKLTPVVRFEKRWGEGTAGDETLLGGGLSWFAYGHTSNLKAFYTHVIPQDPADPYEQFNLQWQLAFY
jgi:hypothetical protein